MSVRNKVLPQFCTAKPRERLEKPGDGCNTRANLSTARTGYAQ